MLSLRSEVPFPVLFCWPASKPHMSISISRGSLVAACTSSECAHRVLFPCNTARLDCFNMYVAFPRSPVRHHSHDHYQSLVAIFLAEGDPAFLLAPGVYRAGEELTDPQTGCKLKGSLHTTLFRRQPCLLLCSSMVLC